MPVLATQRIVLGITGGIAAYKAAELVRRLKDASADVRVVMTANSQRFVGPLTFQALSGHPVHHEGLEAGSESGMAHIELARWAELIVVAPATANFLAKLAHGLADDLLSALCLASEVPLALAPAMNRQMWSAPATQANLAVLRARGVALLGPGEGDQACGETGPGRMLEPEELFEDIRSLSGSGVLAGKTIVVTAGPTLEAIDPVRAITNHSSGRMGYAVARAAARAGARVVLISGPTGLDAPPGVERIPVRSAQQMHEAALAACDGAAVFIGVAAVADYRPAHVETQKIKKSRDRMQLELVRNPDILADVAALPKRPLTIGFAAETEQLERHARAKLVNKNVDLIAANDVSGGSIFGSEDNSLVLIDRTGVQSLGCASKLELAERLIRHIGNLLDASGPDQDT